MGVGGLGIDPGPRTADQPGEISLLSVNLAVGAVFRRKKPWRERVGVVRLGWPGLARRSAKGRAA